MTNLLFALLFCDFSFQTRQKHIYSLIVLRLITLCGNETQHYN